jgi:hypothetical protein
MDPTNVRHKLDPGLAIGLPVDIGFVVGILILCCCVAGRGSTIRRLYKMPPHKVHEEIEEIYLRGLTQSERDKLDAKYKSVTTTYDGAKGEQTITIVAYMTQAELRATRPDYRGPIVRTTQTVPSWPSERTLPKRASQPAPPPPTDSELPPAYAAKRSMVDVQIDSYLEASHICIAFGIG